MSPQARAGRAPHLPRASESGAVPLDWPREARPIQCARQRDKASKHLAFLARAHEECEHAASLDAAREGALAQERKAA